jgi:dihydrofolate reductase
MTSTHTKAGRRVVAQISTTLDGRVSGPKGPADMEVVARYRNIARWLDDVEKVVFSTTMTDATWANSRIAERGPVEEVRQLRGTDGGDILVVNSVSIIRQLLAGEQVDRLLIDLVPEVAGGGATLFEDGLPPSSWTLTDAVTAADGALLLTYDR